MIIKLFLALTAIHCVWCAPQGAPFLEYGLPAGSGLSQSRIPFRQPPSKGPSRAPHQFSGTLELPKYEYIQGSFTQPINPSKAYRLPAPASPVAYAVPEAPPPSPPLTYGTPEAPKVVYRAPQAPPSPPQVTYGAPEAPKVVYRAPEAPASPPQVTYGAPEAPKVVYRAPEAPASPPQVTYGAPEVPKVVYRAPEAPASPPQVTYGAPEVPKVVYRAPQAPAPPPVVYGAPEAPPPVYQAPEAPAVSYGAPQSPPPQPQISYGAPIPAPPSVSHGYPAEQEENGSDIQETEILPGSNSPGRPAFPGDSNSGEESLGSSLSPASTQPDQPAPVPGPKPEAPPAAQINIPPNTSIKVEDDRGQYSHGFANPDGTQVEETGHLISTDNGWEYVIAKEGSYSYKSPEGIPIKVRYIADEKGFRVLSTNFAGR